MKHIFLNLKRFDIPREYGGVNGVRHHFLDREVIEETIKELGDETQYDRNNG